MVIHTCGLVGGRIGQYGMDTYYVEKYDVM